MRSGKLVTCRTKTLVRGGACGRALQLDFSGWGFCRMRVGRMVLHAVCADRGNCPRLQVHCFIRCLEADERNNELLMASDCAFVTGWNLRDPHADKNKPRFRRKIDGLPAVYTLIAADAPAALAQNADNDLAASDDDFGADRVIDRRRWRPRRRDGQDAPRARLPAAAGSRHQASRVSRGVYCATVIQ